MLGDIVREARTRKGLTQARLARLADVSRRHLAALEKGANVSMLVLEKVAIVLELTEIRLDHFSILRTSTQTLNAPMLADTFPEASSARPAKPRPASWPSPRSATPSTPAAGGRSMARRR